MSSTKFVLFGVMSLILTVGVLLGCGTDPTLNDDLNVNQNGGTPQPGPSPCDTTKDCDDEDGCTADSCVAGKCQNTTIQVVDDGVFCNGSEICIPRTGAVVHTGDPCGAGETCHEDSDTCSPIVVIVVPATGPGSLESRNGDTLVFEGGGQPLLAGGIVVGTEDGGFLRKVETATVESDGSVITTTSQASLAEAVQQGSFTFTNGPPGDGRMPQAEPIELFAINESFALEAIEIPAEDGTGSVWVTIPDGRFQLTGKFHLDFTLDHGLKTFACSVSGDAALELDVMIEASVATPFGAEVSVLPEPIRNYYWGLIGTVPVVIEVTTDIFIGFVGEATGTGELQTGFEASSYIEIGAKYDVDRPAGDEWSPINAQDFEFVAQEPAWCWDGSVTAQAYIKPKIEVQLYTVVGPTFDLQPYVQFDAELGGCSSDPDAFYDWTLSAGAAAHATIKADILDLFIIESPPLTLFDFVTVIDCGCDDGVFCNGVETCDSVAGCQSPGDPCPAGTTCNEGINICEPSGICQTNADCVDPELPFCQQENNQCVECLVNLDCEDGDPCTDDECVNSICQYEQLDPCCGDGTCDGDETSCICPADCGSICGDGCCDGDEDSCNCPTDCDGGNDCPDGADLVVDSLTVNGTTLHDGDTLTIAPSTVLNFTHHVANVGDAEAAECRLYTAWGNSYYDLSGFMQDARVGPIPGPGTEDNSDLTGWTAWDTPGTWYITADIDNLDEVTESNENNNMLSIRVVVQD